MHYNVVVRSFKDILSVYQFTFFVTSSNLLYFFTMLSFIISLYINLHVWLTAGGVIVVDKYIDKRLYLFTTTL